MFDVLLIINGLLLYLCMKFSRYIEYLVSSLTANLVRKHTLGRTFFIYIINCFRSYYLVIRQPPTFPHSRPCSILGRISLNHRVRDGNGCCPYPYRHRKFFMVSSSLSYPSSALRAPSPQGEGSFSEKPFSFFEQTCFMMTRQRNNPYFSLPF